MPANSRNCAVSIGAPLLAIASIACVIGCDNRGKGSDETAATSTSIKPDKEDSGFGFNVDMCPAVDGGVYVFSSSKKKLYFVQGAKAYLVEEVKTAAPKARASIRSTSEKRLFALLTWNHLKLKDTQFALDEAQSQLDSPADSQSSDDTDDGPNWP